MAGSNAQAPIVIKKVKKGGGHGHHGGAWKVAYADFVTAMMAFFLLLWLLNATTEEQKKAISNYFAPESVSATKNGSGGMLGGQTMTVDGAMVGKGGTPSVVFAMPPADSKEEDEDAEGRAAMEAADAMQIEAERNIQELASAEIASLKRQEAGAGKAQTDGAEHLAEEAKEKERQAFAAAAQQIRQAIQEIPELAKLADTVIIDQTDDGLRIQLVDQERVAMFPTGSAVMNPQTRALLESVKKVIAKLPNRLAIAGHTDSAPFPSDRGYSNWELSSDRANASRRALVEMGVPAERVARVIGRADNDPLLPQDPRSPRNRRISITLLKQAG